MLVVDDEGRTILAVLRDERATDLDARVFPTVPPGSVPPGTSDDGVCTAVAVEALAPFIGGAERAWHDEILIGLSPEPVAEVRAN